MTINLLIVDDSPVMRRMVARSIGMSGLPVRDLHQAENGVQALSCLQRAWVDLVLTDIHMPEMTGIELVERMTRDPLLAEVPVMVVSTERSEERVEYLQQLGVKAYLNKPFQPEVLAQLVREILGMEES